MATALISGLLRQNVAPMAITVIEPLAAAREWLTQKFAVTTLPEPDAVLQQHDVLILAVKPQQFANMSQQLAPYIEHQLLLSIVAGVGLADIQMCFNHHPRVVRAMPNTPALIGKGMTGLAAPIELSSADRHIVTHIANAVGHTMWVDSDAQLDIVTALSGSGPAYVFYFIEAMQEVAQMMGLSAAQGITLATNTFIGAASLAQESNEEPALLRQRVTSPNGTTYAAINALEKAQVKEIFKEALYLATARSAEIGHELNQQLNATHVTKI